MVRLVVGLVAASVALGCGAAPSEDPRAGGAAVVDCDDADGAPVVALALPSFAPERIELDGPGVVRFQVLDDVSHVVATGEVLGAAPLPDGRVDALLHPGEEACAEFTAPGEHPLYDALFPLDLTAVVVVR